MGIVHHDLTGEVGGNAGGKEVVAIKLPVRVIGGKKQEFIATKMIDDTVDNVGGIRRIEGLHGQAKMIAEDF